MQNRSLDTTLSRCKPASRFGCI